MLPETVLSLDALNWIAGAVGPGATVRSVVRLVGATSSTLYRVEVQHRGQIAGLVLRRFTNQEWLAEEPDLAQHEAASLCKAREAGVCAPSLVACDPHGEHCGVPAVLMTELPGRVELQPRDLDGWLRGLAEAILPLHAVDVGTFPWRYQPYNDLSRLEPPTWSRHPKLWAQVIDLVRGPRPPARECFIHRDYHPTNVLWQGERVSGIVDWPNACRGALGIDLAWCRGNLVGLHGVEAADRFLAAYRSLAGPSYDHHPYWDLIVLIEVLPGPPDVYPPWVEFGVQGLTEEMMRQRLDEYLVHLMSDL